MGKHMSYFIEVVNKATSEILAQANGDLETIAYHVKKLALDGQNEYGVLLNEAEQIGAEAHRKVVSLEADGETVLTVLKARIRSEKKALAVPAAAE